MASKKSRISWKSPEVAKTFLEACIHELITNGREGSSLKQLSWKNVAEKLKTKNNFIVDQKQMKNRYDYLKAKFTAWSKLKNKTGNVYDPLTNSFNLSEEQWQLETKSNKHVEALRTSPLLYPELCVQLFEGSTSNGFDSWGPSSTLPRSFVEVMTQSLDAFDDVEYSPMEHPTVGISEESPDRSKAKRKDHDNSGESSILNKKEKRKGKESLNSALIEVGEKISKVADMLIEKHNISNDMDACMEKLGAMEWDKVDPKYQTALLPFGESPDIRKVWLRIPPDTCEMWVKNAGAKYGLF
ncbi:hypothetical protein M8C21_012667 [Ambrosia artemisiifolia]|uniref:Myb/SANT-like domain-containing protein n=1 Tax=Ambrosia artemisiifolia TaxID=4212 RepID=A0AAD5CRM1_AMBAR|nr:hypothetical protein M8C21_012667 [Ambrosia artemisiifolia]